MVAHLDDICAERGVFLQAPLHERYRGPADRSRFGLADDDAAFLCILFSREWGVAGEKIGKEDSEGPYLCWRRLIWLLQEDLGGCVGCRSKEQVICRTGFRRVCDDCAAEVNKLHLYHVSVNNGLTTNDIA